MHTPTGNVDGIRCCVHYGVDAVHALRQRWSHAPGVGRRVIDVEARVCTTRGTSRVGSLAANCIDLPVQVDACAHTSTLLREGGNVRVGA